VKKREPTWVQVRSLAGNADTVFSLATTSKEDLIASCARDGSVRVWNRATGVCLKQWCIPEGWMLQVRFLNDGRAIAGGSPKKCMLWDVESGAVLATFPGDRVSIGARPGGSVLALGSAQGELALFDSHSLKVLGRLALFDGATHAITMNGEESTILASGGGTIASVNIVERKINWTAKGHAAGVSMSCILTDAALGFVVSCGYDGTARVWEFASGSPIAELKHEGGVAGGALSPDGRLLFTHGTKNLVWETGSWTLKQTLPKGTVTKSLYSPDGASLITSGLDGSIRIWDSYSGAPLGVLPASRKRLHDILLCDDGQELICCGDDPKCSVWRNVPT
jgi:WD40 repeat protein